MDKSVIVGFARTPFGRFGGRLKDYSAAQLESVALSEAINRSGAKFNDAQLVIIGQVLQGGCGQIPGRQAALKAGVPADVPVDLINKVCASSMRAVTLADQVIRSGDADCVFTGGMESMSNAPFFTSDIRWGHRMYDVKFKDLMVNDGLWCPYYNVHMAVHGGKLALENGISREMQDRWAVESQQRAENAILNGFLDREIVSIIDGKHGVIAEDEAPRFGTTYEVLKNLDGLFDKDNTVTAGNAPGVNDGAAAIVVMNAETAFSRGIQPEAVILGHAMCSEDPANIATAPGNAINKLLRKQNLRVEDIDLFEINEAFAAVTLLSSKIVGCDLDRVNVNGGAIAYGHPLGASGARIIMTLICELQRRNLRYGIAAICSGMGQGDAILIENCRYSGMKS